MNDFKIESNNFLKKSVIGFYNSNYSGGGRWKEDGTIEQVICTLKNDITPFSDSKLCKAVENLKNILKKDLPEIIYKTGFRKLTVCLVPRAKVNYTDKQLLLKHTVRCVLKELDGFEDGVDYITRTKDTRTTHRNRSGYGGKGDLPYPGITEETCEISRNVEDKDILLIDDLYTKTVNIDEDAIQALLDHKANSVTFYSIGCTI